MAPPPSDPAPPARPSPFQELAGTLVRYLEARLRLAQIESGEACARVITVLLLAALAFASLLFAWLVILPPLVWFLSQKYAVSWQMAAVATACAHFALGFLLLVVLRIRLRRLRLFEASIGEFKKERDWLAPGKS